MLLVDVPTRSLWDSTLGAGDDSAICCDRAWPCALGHSAGHAWLRRVQDSAAHVHMMESSMTHSALVTAAHSVSDIVLSSPNSISAVFLSLLSRFHRTSMPRNSARGGAAAGDGVIAPASAGDSTISIASDCIDSAGSIDGGSDGRAAHSHSPPAPSASDFLQVSQVLTVQLFCILVVSVVDDSVDSSVRTYGNEYLGGAS